MYYELYSIFYSKKISLYHVSLSMYVYVCMCVCVNNFICLHAICILISHPHIYMHAWTKRALVEFHWQSVVVIIVKLLPHVVLFCANIINKRYNRRIVIVIVYLFAIKIMRILTYLTKCMCLAVFVSLVKNRKILKQEKNVNSCTHAIIPFTSAFLIA